MSQASSTPVTSAPAILITSGLPPVEGFKKPFAIITDGSEQWRGTLHLLDLRTVPPELHLPSLECRRLARDDCEVGPCLQASVQQLDRDKYQNYPGGLFCCDAGSHHSGSSQFDFSDTSSIHSPENLPTLTYRLKFTIDYIPLNSPASAIDFGLTPLSSTAWQHRFVNVYGTTIQVEAPAAEYSVPVCADGDDMCIDVKTTTWSVQSDRITCIDCPHSTKHNLPAPGAPSGASTVSIPLPSARVGVAWASGHQHDGALGIQLWLQRPGSMSKELICHSAPVIGSEDGIAGNEKGFITGIEPCRRDDPLEVPVGSTLQVRSMYDAHPPRYDMSRYYVPQDGLQYAHVGVMGYMRVRFVDMDAFERTVTNPWPPAQCTDIETFTAWSEAVTAACCTDSSSCNGGLPASCQSACANVLLPMQRACGDFLETTGMRDVVDQAAALCPTNSGH